MALFALPAIVAIGPGLGACIESSPSGVVTAPTAETSSVPPAGSSALDAATTSASSTADGSPAAGVAGASGIADSNASPGVADGGVPARFRACQTDAECIAVPRVGCCHNGQKEAVAATEKDAYAASFVCPEAHPLCAMFIVRDTRQPICDPATHLCTLIAR